MLHRAEEKYNGVSRMLGTSRVPPLVGPMDVEAARSKRLVRADSTTGGAGR